MEPKEIPQKVHSAVELVKNVYQVVVELPREVDKPRKWKLEVVDKRGKKMKGVTVFYPRLLLPLEEAEQKENGN